VVLDAESVAALHPIQLIALLESGERLDQESAPIHTIGIPAWDLPGIRELARRGPTVLACRYGLRSAALARLLRSEGMEKIYAQAASLAAIRAPA
jgi:adenylyltransferase/sulfurtransferase